VLYVLGQQRLKRVDASFQEFCLHSGKQIICLLALGNSRAVNRARAILCQRQVALRTALRYRLAREIKWNDAGL
jgi:hypothetical protein